MLALEKERKSMRKLTVQNSIASTPEKNAQVYILESLIPSLSSSLAELLKHVLKLQSTINQSVQVYETISQQHSPMAGNFSPSAPLRGPIQQNREVIWYYIANLVLLHEY